MNSLGYDTTDGYSERRKIIIILILCAIVAFSGVISLILGVYNISIELVYQTLVVHVTMSDFSPISKLHSTII